MSSNQNKKKGKPFLWLSVILYMTAAVVCGIYLGNYTVSIGLSERGQTEKLLFYALFFMGCYAAIYLDIILHELGHWLFGCISGYRFVSFRIGNLTWIRGRDGHIHFKRMTMIGTGGQCLLSPPDMTEKGIPVVLYNYGGCLLNFVVSVIMLVVFFLWGGSLSLIKLLLLAGASFGFVLALTNGIPMETGMMANDGKNALSLRHDTVAMKAFWLQLRINEQQTQGVRLKDMPEEWFALPTAEQMKNPLTAALGVFGCNRLMDQGRLEEADERMKYLLTSDIAMNGVYYRLLTCDRMFCEIVGQHRADVIETMRTAEQLKFMKLMHTNPSVIRTEYAYRLLVAKDPQRAGEQKALFEKFAAKYPYEADIMSERELISRVDRIYEQIKEALA